MRRRIILFVAILGIMAVLVGVIAGVSTLTSDGYSAQELSETAVALDVRATEVSMAATRLATEYSLASGYSSDEVAINGPTPEAPSGPGSRTEPVEPLQPFRTSDGWEIRVLAANYDAWPQVQAANQFNDPPRPGYRMLLVTVQVANVGGSLSEARNISDSDFRITGDKGVVYTTFGDSTRCGVVPDSLNWEMFPGAVVSGNICVQFPEDENGLLLMYNPSSMEQDQPVYFALP